MIFRTAFGTVYHKMAVPIPAIWVSHALVAWGGEVLWDAQGTDKAGPNLQAAFAVGHIPYPSQRQVFAGLHRMLLVLDGEDA